MILIADSGSTKTDWALISDQSSVIVATQGISPVHQSDAQIRQILTNELLPQLAAADIDAVYFYGSGVRSDKEVPMASLLRELFPVAEAVEAHSDLLGAARALCGRKEGVACILGTGANSCFYDGCQVIQNTSALGYILGDEGSGAVLGRTLLNEIYKGVLSEKIKALFEEETGLTLNEVIERVYRQPLPNRFLASHAPFIHRHLADSGVRSMVIRCFCEFFSKNIKPYNRMDLPVGFVGSVAWYFSNELREAAEMTGFSVGRILQSPISALVDYHL